MDGVNEIGAESIPSRNFIALVGDVVGSKEVADRADLQERLRIGLDEVNDRFKEVIAAQFVLTVGDEFQGLLNSPDELAMILGRLRTHAFPAKLRFGLGLGKLSTPLRAQALGMDGPCFHRARAAVERAVVRGTSMEVEADSQKGAFDIYALLRAHMQSGWTERQRQVADLAMAGLEGVEIAERLSVTPSAISQHLRAAGAKPLGEATRVWIEAIRLALREAD